MTVQIQVVIVLKKLYQQIWKTEMHSFTWEARKWCISCYFKWLRRYIFVRRDLWVLFMLKNVLANCKTYDSPANWLITYNNGWIKFISQIFSLVAGRNFAKSYRNRLLWALTSYKSVSAEPFELCWKMFSLPSKLMTAPPII